MAHGVGMKINVHPNAMPSCLENAMHHLKKEVLEVIQMSPISGEYEGMMHHHDLVSSNTKLHANGWSVPGVYACCRYAAHARCLSCA